MTRNQVMGRNAVERYGSNTIACGNTRKAVSNAWHRVENSRVAKQSILLGFLGAPITDHYRCPRCQDRRLQVIIHGTTITQ